MSDEIKPEAEIETGVDRGAEEAVSNPEEVQVGEPEVAPSDEVPAEEAKEPETE